MQLCISKFIAKETEWEENNLNESIILKISQENKKIKYTNTKIKEAV